MGIPDVGLLVLKIELKNHMLLWCINPVNFLSGAGKRYNIADVSAAICMSLGLIWFTLADSTVAPNFNLTGKKSSFFIRNNVYKN